MEITAATVAADRAAIAVEGTLMAQLAEAAWDREVPTCPGWDVGTLVGHAGATHRWAAANLTTGGRVRISQLPPPPDGRDARLVWFADGLSGLVDATVSVDPETEVWTFAASGERRSAWWLRRMAQETGLHRWDAAAALAVDGGPPPAPFDTRRSVAGIDEYLLDFLPRLAPRTFEGWHGTLHLHATDTGTDADGEWVLDLGDMTRPVRRGHARADTALQGPASDLLLWLWNRQPADGLTVVGDASVVERWREVRI